LHPWTRSPKSKSPSPRNQVANTRQNPRPPSAKPSIAKSEEQKRWLGVRGNEQGHRNGKAPARTGTARAKAKRAVFAQRAKNGNLALPVWLYEFLSAVSLLFAPLISLAFQDQLPMNSGAATFAENNVRFSVVSLGFRTIDP
jgi:hypothetical protein